MKEYKRRSGRSFKRACWISADTLDFLYPVEETPEVRAERRSIEEAEAELQEVYSAKLYR